MTSTSRTNRWLVRIAPRPSARVRLFCFPYAGGGATTFYKWANDLPRDVEILAVQPPGRENRREEPAYTRLEPMVTAIVDTIESSLDRPFVFFGHSLGAIAAFETARALRDAGRPEPVHLVVSGHPPPHVPSRVPSRYDRSEEDFVREIRGMSGTPDDLFDNPELRALYLPVLRKDFEVNDTYAYRPGAALDCGITALSGLQDPDVDPAELSQWATHTRGRLDTHIFEGGHFFINTERAAVLRILTQILKRALLRAALSETLAAQRSVVPADHADDSRPTRF